MLEGDRGQPVDADVNVLRRFLASGDVEVASTRRAAADEHGVVALLQQRLHRIDALAAAELDAEVEDVAALLVDHAVGQPELRDLRAHHAAGLRIAVEHDAFVAERREIARDGQRRGPAADERDALAVLLRCGLRKPRADVALEVGGGALQAADCDGLGLRARLAVLGRALLDAHAAARRLARAIARAAQDPRENVRLPVDQVGVVVTPLRNQPDVLGNGRVRGARPLAIDNLVEVVRLSDIRRFQAFSSNRPRRRALQEGLLAGRARDGAPSMLRRERWPASYA